MNPYCNNGFDYNASKVDKYNHLDSIIFSLTAKYNRLWWGLCKMPYVNKGTTMNFWMKRMREKDTDEFIYNFIDSVKRYPSSFENRAKWKEELNCLIDEFISKTSLMNRDEMVFLLSKGILEGTKLFMDKTNKFDDTLKFEDVGQAMRNVWIMNITQILLHIPVKCTDSVFAYSMLYPYTDNYLDNIEFSSKNKNNYSIRFEKRLRGEAVEPENSYESRIFTLVGLIENQYPRSFFPEVYESLLGIHRGQNKSVFQQDKKLTPYDLDVLGISIEKGGTSVLADAFLVKGKLSISEMEFFFAYGMMLQLCDDLQDIKEDLKNNHFTIFSHTSKAWDLDNITKGLFNLVDYVTELIDILKISDAELFKGIIEKNCYFLIYFAAAKNKQFYSKDFYNNIMPHFPYSTGYMKGLFRKLSKKYKELQPSYNGVKTEDILMEALRR